MEGNKNIFSIVYGVIYHTKKTAIRIKGLRGLLLKGFTDTDQHLLSTEGGICCYLLFADNASHLRHCDLPRQLGKDNRMLSPVLEHQPQVSLLV